jgi:death on curing protein
MPKRRWTWIALDVTYAVHERQIAEHGGAEGVRDPALVESALIRPANFAAYGSPDAAELAAAYAWGLARNHGFVDGNKRTAWVVARLFLRLNQMDIAFESVEAVRTMENVAAGLTDETLLARWFRERIRPARTRARPRRSRKLPPSSPR